MLPLLFVPALLMAGNEGSDPPGNCNVLPDVVTTLVEVEARRITPPARPRVATSTIYPAASPNSAGVPRLPPLMDLRELAEGMARVLEGEPPSSPGRRHPPIREERARTPRPDPRAEPDTDPEGPRVRPRRLPPIREEYTPVRRDPRAEADTDPQGLSVGGRSPPRVGPASDPANPSTPTRPPPPSEPTHEADRIYRERVGSERSRLTEEDYTELRLRQEGDTEVDSLGDLERRRSSLPLERETHRPEGPRATIPPARRPRRESRGSTVHAAPSLTDAASRGHVTLLGRARAFILRHFEYRAPPPGQSARTTLQNYIDSPTGFHIRAPDGTSVRITGIEARLGRGGFQTAYRVMGEDGLTYVARVMDPTRTGMSPDAIAIALRRIRDLSPPLQEAAADLSRSVTAEMGEGLRVEFVVNPNLADEDARAFGITAQEDYSSAGDLTVGAQQSLSRRGYGPIFAGYENFGLEANAQYLTRFALGDPELAHAVLGAGIPNRPNYRTGYSESALPDIRRGSLRGTFVNTKYRFLPDGTLQVIAFDAL